jgi:hypothetical protein
MEKYNGLVVSLTSPKFANCHYAIIPEILVKHSTIIRYSNKVMALHTTDAESRDSRIDG